MLKSIKSAWAFLNSALRGMLSADRFNIQVKRNCCAAFFILLFVIPINPSFAQNSDAGGATNNQTVRVTLQAVLNADGTPVEKGLEWRVFGPNIGADGALPLLANATGGTRSFNISPGEYLVHVAFGHSSAIRKIEVSSKSDLELFILNAGAMELSAVSGVDTPIPPVDLRFDIYEQTQDARGERRLIASRVLPDQIVPFQAGTYHVVSQYGDLNAEIRADIIVTAGKVTKAQMKHRASRITLRLLGRVTGDALANTQWSVLNESGDLITESTSAFPSIVLSEGAYTAIAKNSERIYSQDFMVKAGLKQEIEIIAK